MKLQTDRPKHGLSCKYLMYQDVTFIGVSYSGGKGTFPQQRFIQMQKKHPQLKRGFYFISRYYNDFYLIMFNQDVITKALEHSMLRVTKGCEEKFVQKTIWRYVWACFNY